MKTVDEIMEQFPAQFGKGALGQSYVCTRLEATILCEQIKLLRTKLALAEAKIPYWQTIDTAPTGQEGSKT